MITIFSTSTLSSLPSQAVSTIRRNVFERLTPADVSYWTATDNDAPTSGSIKKIPSGKNRYARYLKKIYWMHKVKPDIILFTGEFFELFLYMLRPRKAKVVLHLNGPLPESISRYPYRNMRYRILWHSVVFFTKRAHSVITITQHTAETVETFRHNVPTYVIYNGVDLHTFKPSKEKDKDREYLHETFDIEKSKPLVTYVGSLIARKRPDMIIAIAAECPAVSFVLVGGTSPELDMTRLINDSKNIYHIPSMQRADIARLLGVSDAFCFPSLYEGFGMVVAEAMAAGCPPIVSAGSGPEELVADKENGFVIPLQQKQSEIVAFVNAVKALTSDTSMREHFSQSAVRAAAQFDWNIIAPQWKEVLQKIVS